MTGGELLPFAALGLLGSLHCVGMCGGFALAAGRRDGCSSPCARRQSGYILGKAAGYAAIGGAAAAGARALAPAGFELGFWQTALSVVAGVVLIALGLRQLGWAFRGPGLSSERLTRVFRHLHAGAASLPGPAGPFGLGVLNALLPCGLSWAAFALAATHSPATAVVGCFVFGLATAPLLVAFAWSPRFLPLRARRHAPRVIALLLLAFGGSTLLHAYRSHGEAVPPCCEPAPAVDARQSAR